MNNIVTQGKINVKSYPEFLSNINNSRTFRACLKMFWRKISYKNKYEKDFNSILIPCNSPFHHQKLLPHSRKFPQHNFSPFGCLVPVFSGNAIYHYWIHQYFYLWKYHRVIEIRPSGMVRLAAKNCLFQMDIFLLKQDFCFFRIF